jgi:hypothetical protein
MPLRKRSGNPAAKPPDHLSPQALINLQYLALKWSGLPSLLSCIFRPSSAPESPKRFSPRHLPTHNQCYSDINMTKTRHISVYTTGEEDIFSYHLKNLICLFDRESVRDNLLVLRDFPFFNRLSLQVQERVPIGTALAC